MFKRESIKQLNKLFLKLLNKLLQFLISTNLRFLMNYLKNKESKLLWIIIFQFTEDTNVMDVELNQSLETATNPQFFKILIFVNNAKLLFNMNILSSKSNSLNKDLTLSFPLYKMIIKSILK